jgi:hypothetical protein
MAYGELVQTVTTKHRSIRERHLAVDVLASVIGADIFYTIISRSWVYGVVAIILSGVLYVVDKIGIENEEKSGD